MTNPNKELAFTGERFTPECEREIWYEHWHRYVFARELARGKRILDAACGEGYGSAMLAEVADEVIGVDIDARTIAHARTRYGERANLQFKCADCTRLGIESHSIDLVVSFETLEHVHAQRDLIAGFASALKDDGVLIVSSPDRHAYSDARDFHNEFHVHELYRDELLALLNEHFEHVRLFGQKLLFQSAIWTLDGGADSARLYTQSSEDGRVREGPGYEPLYFLALCSRQPIKLPIPDVSLFGDTEESVYQHYNGEVRRNMSAGQRIAELETEIARLKQESGELAVSDVSTPASGWQRIRKWFLR